MRLTNECGILQYKTHYIYKRLQKERIEYKEDNRVRVEFIASPSPSKSFSLKNLLILDAAE